MEGVSPVFKWVKTLEYDIVVKKFNYARIIIFCNDVDEENIHVSYDKNKVVIYGFSDYTHVYRLNIRLWFKIKKLKHVFRNGILTLDVKGYHLIPFLL